ncbi:TetR/AcrR family transcriptional regulator [Solimonas marina]|uniref:TetR/AcrR family transcriptional regulator n=1 Tax=Solimonas marina TaxID=2714601 RepID=A0A969WAX4_9GAMM|nr:TetR/AcrR family transcriptional regulator [Solimonas marina]NKF22141.1 TetR/AcrR family transcriptional regulator [Solimonas marina]
MAYQRSALMQERLSENRARILAAARQLVAEGGFRAASITAVARVSGLSTGAIYRYFPSKSVLFVEVLTSAVAHECEILTAIVDGDGSARERLRAAVASFARRALKGPHLAFAFIAEPADPDVEAARILCRRDFGDVFKRVLRAGMASGEFPKQSVDVGAACIVGAFTEALVRPVEHAGGRRSDQALVRAIVDFCDRAVGGTD